MADTELMLTILRDVQARLGRMEIILREHTSRLGRIERQTAEAGVVHAEQSLRIDRLAERIDRIEQRLELEP